MCGKEHRIFELSEGKNLNILWMPWKLGALSLPVEHLEGLLKTWTHNLLITWLIPLFGRSHRSLREKEIESAQTYSKENNSTIAFYLSQRPQGVLNGASH